MKFLLIAPRFHTNLYYQVMSLQQAGNPVKVLVLYKGISEYYDNIDIEVIKLSFFSRMISGFLRLFRKNYLKSDLELRFQSPGKELKKQIKQFKPDVILLKAYQDLLAMKVLFIARLFMIKVLMMTQTPYAHIKGSAFLFKLNIWLFKKLGLKAFITPILINYKVFKDSGIQNVYYLPFVYPVTKSTEKKGFEEGFKILSIGKFVKRKDHLLLVKAVEKLSVKYKIRLHIVGEKADQNCYQQIENYIKDKSLNRIISLGNHMPYNEIDKLYRQFHLFVLAAFDEPAAYSPLEAMANGLPVICSSQNGTSCYIEEGKNGFIFESKNLGDLCIQIEKVILSKDEWQKMSDQAFETAKRNHNPENFSEKVLKLIE